MKKLIHIIHIWLKGPGRVDKLLFVIQNLVFCLAAISLFPFKGFWTLKPSSLDMAHFGTVIWLGLAWFWWLQQDRNHRELTKMNDLAFKMTDKLQETKIVNQVLLKILDRIDKNVLRKHGITIKIDHKGERTIN